MGELAGGEAGKVGLVHISFARYPWDGGKSRMGGEEEWEKAEDERRRRKKKAA